MLTRKVFLFHILLLSASYAIDDNLSRGSLILEKELPFNLSIELEQSLRLEDQSKRFKQTFTEVGLSYDINKYIKVEIPYRYAIFKDKKKQRISFSSTLKIKKNNSTFRYKGRIQSTYEKENREDVVRNKFTYEHEINNKYEPFLSFEILSPYDKEVKNVDDYRISFGSEINLPNKTSLKLYYIYQKEDLLEENFIKNNIIGITYNIKL